MIGSSRKQASRQARTTTPASIAQINQNLMARRLTAGEARELLVAEYPVWGAMRGQFKGRQVAVGPEFVVADTLDERESALGFLGLLSVEKVDFAKYLDGRENGIKYVGDAVVAHLFEDVERRSETARVFVSIPGELSVASVPERTVFAAIEGRP